MDRTGWMTPERWEHGSHFALPPTGRELGSGSVLHFANQLEAILVGSGRVALGLVIENGMSERGWRRLWVPSYFCEDVMHYLAGLGITLARYTCGPWGEDRHPEGEPGDVLLRVNYFGRGLTSLERPFMGDIIDDHTHDPQALQWSSADFAIASLRKVLPVPDGGILCSPAGHPLPSAPTLKPAHDAAVSARIAAMALKRAYLGGYGNNAIKTRVRELELATEDVLLVGESSAVSDWTRLMLGRLSLERSSDARLRNHQVLVRELKGCDAATIFAASPDRAPMIAVISLSSQAVRDDVRTKLIDRRIYPAVLWPMPKSVPDILASASEFSSKALMLHIDERYDAQDMEHVAAEIKQAIAEMVVAP